MNERWQLPEGRIQPGPMQHSIGLPNDSQTYGGSFNYHPDQNPVYVGFVVGLEYKDPRLLPFEAFQQFKHHLTVMPRLEGGAIFAAGARTIAAGGWQSIRRLRIPGAMLIGDAAGGVKLPKVNDVRQAIRSGMLAAEHMAETDSSEGFDVSWRASRGVREVHAVRNFKPGVKRGSWCGLANAGLEVITRGRTPWTLKNSVPGHPIVERLWKYEFPERRWVERMFPPRDRLVSVFFASKSQDESQPAHRKVRGASVCSGRCATDFGSPCTGFCPRNVYKMVDDGTGGKRLQINAANCVHCKGCDIRDSYGISDWTSPEGSSGPSYQSLYTHDRHPSTIVRPGILSVHSLQPRIGPSRIMTQGIHRNFIDGIWRDAGHYRPNVNPSDTTDIVGSYAQATASEAQEAIEAAARAFESWQFSAVQDRFDALDFIGAELLARRDELGRLLSREEGKTVKEGIGEVARAGSVFKFFAGEALRIPGELLASTRPGVGVEVTREPIGVVGIIAPWNFPMAIPAWKIAPALCYGNTVVFKPAELVPGCAWALTEIISRCGLPAGVFNLVMGRGSVVGDALVTSPVVNGISFTGSESTGARIVTKVASRSAKVQVEMGGKNPLVVLDDADLDVAVGAAIQGAYFSTGQRCTASSRLIVTQGIHDRFVAALREKLSALKVGHALEPDTEIGPVVDAQQLEQDQRYLEIGQSEGATLAFGGRTLKRPTQGFFLEPALFTDTTTGMRINQEEIFGPVASVIRVRDFEDALQAANGVPFGLSSGICTTSLAYAAAFRRRAQAGMVMVNLPTAGVDYHVPFGGRKASSYGPREQGRYAMDFFTVVKTSYIAP